MSFHCKIIFLACAIAAFSSCVRERSTSVNFKLSTENNFPEITETSFTIDTAEQSLIISVSINNVSAFQHPVHPQTGDTLTFSALRFDFYEGTRPVETTSCRCNFSYDYNPSFGFYSLAAKTLSFTTDTLDFSLPQKIVFKLPLYNLRNIQAGSLKNLNVKINSSKFFSKPRTHKKIINGDTLQVTERESTAGNGLHVMLSCVINMPKVYSSTFICNRIILQNDSAWNPAGSDFTIFRSSLPDVYYEIYNPGNFSYYRSRFQKSTVEFNRPDSCLLYFYSPQDSITIGIYDHDNFSKDDVLGNIRCTLHQLQESSHKPLKDFHVAGLSASIINVKAEN